MSLKLNITQHVSVRLISKFIEVINILFIGYMFNDYILGQFNNFIMESSLVILLLGLGLSNSFLYLVKNKEISALSALHKSNLYLLICLFFLFFVYYIFPQAWKFNFTLQNFLFWIFLYSAAGIWQENNFSITLSFSKIKEINLLFLTIPILISILLVLHFFHFIQLDLWLLIKIYTCGQLFYGIIASIFIYYHRRERTTVSNNYSKLFKYSNLVYITNIFQFLSYRFDYWILEKYHISQFGVYTFYAQMISFIWFIPIKASDIIFIHSIAEKEKIVPKVIILSKLVFYFSIIMVLAICIGSYIIFSILKMTEYYTTIPYLIASCIALSLFSSSIIFASFQSAMRNLKINFLQSFFASILAVLLSIWLIPKYGAWGAVAESSIIYFLSFIFQLFYFSKYSKNLKYLLFSNPIKDFKKLINEKYFSIS